MEQFWEVDIQQQFETFCSDIGMSMTTALCIFAKVAVREQKIPFEIVAGNDPFYGPQNKARLKRSIEQMEKPGGTVHEVNLDDKDKCCFKRVKKTNPGKGG